LAHFNRKLQVMDEDEVDRELYYRKAQRFVPNRQGQGGQWRRLESEEYQGGFRYVAGFFSELQRQLEHAPEQALIEDKSGKKPLLQRITSKEMAKTGEEAMKNLWVQIKHPLSLKAAFAQKKPGAVPKFDEYRYVSERAWDEMRTNALRMSEAYEGYAVMYAAALADVVDTHYKELLGTLDSVVADGYQLLKVVEDMERGGGTLEIHQLERMVKEVENGELRQRLQKLLDSLRINRTESSGGAGDLVNEVMEQADREIDELEQAHFSFLSSQLAVYEQSKDVVKSLAGQGLNVAGKFVEAAAALAASRGRGGGRGV